ncbi:flagellar hook-basal body protein [Diplocloster agilis]|uniref:Flagellar hook-basal body protein n=1 Tax=Diplocloster agilis TaxID=2850323 RepID=A0A949K3U7_9FIRM|nr:MULTISPECIES: flagellar hook-basal body protein [Lachnospiraceae]MBU9739284.1 flagellar hook-basal body protein [Diplocloster agilis]MBU9744667.1 flagellar hook-basal body protein [Diplocloster agilis]MCU6734550.1 flagellar hook-basal body protein [Suonthocola fibrivorans]SCJ44323.1 Distal rod protein [uncultured Clostridium sp.]
MFSGFYTAASGVLMNQRALNLSANNIANMKTPGYHSKRLLRTTFEEELVRQENGQTTPIGGGAPISIVAAEASTYKQGMIEETGKIYDLAINGNGFFVVQGEDREYLTRSGNFTRDEEGYLVLPGIGRVLGDNGQIQVGDAGFTIGLDGRVYDAAGQERNQIRLVAPENYDNLVFYDNGTYGVEDGAQLNRVYPDVYQGNLERSDVDLNAEMTRAMECQRAFQSCGKALTIIDQMNQKTSSEIGKL